MTKKRSTVSLILAALLTVGMLCCLSGCNSIVNWLFSSQYNENGISHFLVITIDENQAKEYIGTLGDHDVYVEKLDIDETCFRSIDAENVSIKDAIENNLVSIEDWRKYARNIKTDGDIAILQFENYEIAVSSDECIIRPLQG